jgi:hypothetical protein
MKGKRTSTRSKTSSAKSRYSNDESRPALGAFDRAVNRLITWGTRLDYVAALGANQPIKQQTLTPGRFRR